MPDNRVRLEYTGINRGPIPFKGISGNVYRGSSETYRFVDALPEDVGSLVGTGKFKVLDREPAKAPEISDDDEITIDAPETPENEPKSFTGPVIVDLSTVETVKSSIADNPIFSKLKFALELEKGKDKPRSTVVKHLENAIENHPDYFGDL